MNLPRPMTIATLASRARGATVLGDGSATFTDVEYDSRRAGKGTLFFCRPGSRFDSHDIAAQVYASGATGFVCQRRLEVAAPQIIVDDVAAQMGPLASFAFGDPTRGMTLIGITGTNGKTTTAFMLERCLQQLGMKTGLIGTVETHVGKSVEAAGRTTPESIDLQRLFARMRSEGVDAAAMEVSSHGLSLHRVDGTRFACAVFTNLTQDHLDFHASMDAYLDAKAMLFETSFTDAAAVNADDEAGLSIARRAAAAGLAVTTFSAGSADADVLAADIAMYASGSTFTCSTASSSFTVHVPLAGPFNISNALAALTAVDACGLDAAAAAEGIGTLPGVPGRFERIDAGQDFTVLVDYAHTPDSVERALRAARQICTGALTVVVGCGGDRDRAKRPLMGRAAVAIADRAILTSDNPRSEDPHAILEEMEAGARDAGKPYEVEPDRREAIRLAFAGAKSGDVIVIAGKGHESGQEFADHTIPFDDRLVAREELARQ